jgi:hypothetical protein
LILEIEWPRKVKGEEYLLNDYLCPCEEYQEMTGTCRVFELI